jgi:hypothetical protein
MNLKGLMYDIDIAGGQCYYFLIELTVNQRHAVAQ